MGPAAAYASAELPEAPYSIWNIMGLVLILIFLSLTGVLMTGPSGEPAVFDLTAFGGAIDGIANAESLRA